MSASSSAPMLQDSQSSTPQHLVIDRDVWLACAAPYSGRLPAVGSLVYYLPHGHAEQCHASTEHLIPTWDGVACTVTDLVLSVDAVTHEAYATISLIPGDCYVPPRQVPVHALGPGQREFCFFDKQLSESEVVRHNAAFLMAPESIAEDVLPTPVNLSADQPAQYLVVTDLRGARWRFRHRRSDTNRCRLLTDGWSAFVNAKRLCAGDTVVFMRHPGGELLVGVRRKPYGGMPVGVPANRVADAAWKAMCGQEFKAAYYPRQNTAEFVVRREEVEESLGRAPPLTPGTTVRLLMNPEDTRRRTESVSGTVRTVHSQ